MDKDGYPTEQELKTIKDWDVTKEPVQELLEFIRQRWKYAGDGYFKLTGKRILKLELHTGGWSGNEDIIRALEESFFWTLWWEKSERGGHYYFKIKPIPKAKKSK